MMHLHRGDPVKEVVAFEVLLYITHIDVGKAHAQHIKSNTL